jgi:chemotaxis family two-component system sensor kinase Cph1
MKQFFCPVLSTTGKIPRLPPASVRVRSGLIPGWHTRAFFQSMYAMTQLSDEHLNQAIANCAQEPIRTPGSIQPHGFALFLDAGLRVLQVSDNLAKHTGIAPESALGQPLDALFGADAVQGLRAEMERMPLRRNPAYLDTLEFAGGRYDVLGHEYDGLLTLECERTERSGGADFRHLYPLVGDFLRKLDDTQGVADMCTLAAHEIRALTRFGRVLVYRFDDEGHGHVLGESRDDAHPSFGDHRFPGSDIPAQARELYVLNRLRLIADADYTPSRLLPALNPLTGKANDLSFCALRSVSPVHLQYMRNMHTWPRCRCRWSCAASCGA